MDQLQVNQALQALRSSVASVPLPSFELFSIEQLIDLPAPRWVVDDIIEENVLAVLYGPSGQGKSFIALDLSLSVATNQKWQNHGVSGGPVVYVVAEGSRGIGKRVKAWMKHHHVRNISDMFFILRAVELNDNRQIRGLLTNLEQRGVKPRLIVIDTLARCFDGDENSSQDMGEVVRACGDVQHATGATVLLVHHTGKGANSRTERGSSALRGAADTMIHVSMDGSIVRIKVDKQKDDEPAEAIRLRLAQVVIDDGHSGSDTTSCILVPTDPAPHIRPTLPVGAVATLQTLLNFEGQAESGAWRGAIRLANGNDISDETFHRHKRRLLEDGFVRQVDDRKHWYQITEEGTVTAKRLPMACQRQLPSVSAATATPPIGVAGGTGEAESSSVPREDGGTAADQMPLVVEGEGGDAGR